MRYEIIIKPSAEKALDLLSKPIRTRVIEVLEELCDQPRPPGCVKLSGEENIWRIRVGEWRIVYEIHDRRLVVLVVRIGHRKDIYRR